MYYYQKLLFSTLLISIVLFIAAVTAISFLQYKSTSDSHIKDLENSSRTTLANFSKIFADTHNIDILLTNNSDVNSYVSEANPHPYTITKSADYLNRTLFSQKSNCYMNAISKIDDNYVISPQTTDLGHYCELIGLNKGSLSAFKRTPASADGKQTVQFLTSEINSQPAITYLRQQYSSTGSNYVLLSTYLLENLVEMPEYTATTALVSFFGKPIASYGELDFDAAVKFADTSDSAYSFYTVQTDDVTGSEGIDVIYMTNKLGFFGYALGNMAWLFFIFIFLFALLVALSYFVVKRNYLPVKSTLDNLGKMGISAENENEFEVISDSLRITIDKNKQLAKSLDKGKLIIEQNFFKNLASGVLTAEEARAFLAKNYPEITAGSYVYIIFSYNSYAQLEQKLGAEGIAQAKKKVKSAVYDYFSHHDFHVAFDIDSKSLALILKDKSPDKLDDVIKSFIIQLESDYHIELYSVIGSPSEDIVSIHDSFLSAKAVYDSVVFLQAQHLVYNAKSFAGLNSKAFIYPLDLEAALIESAVQCNMPTVSVTLDKIKELFVKQCGFSPDAFSYLIFMSASTINRAVSAVNKSPEDIFGQNVNLYLELRMQSSADALFEKLKYMYALIIDSNESAIKSTDKKSMQSMLSFINENYMNDISLLNLSEMLNISQNYAGRLFKQSTGTNFKEYLTRYRFTKAKEIMSEDKKIKIKDLASMVGCNSEMLTRIFLKYAEKTPREFRDSI